MRELYYTVLENNGYQEVADLQRKVYESEVSMDVRSNQKPHLSEPTAKHSPFVCKGPSEGRRPDLRFTGEASTCLANSIVNGIVSGVVLTECIQEAPDFEEDNVFRVTESVEDGYARAGFKAKLSLSGGPEWHTFLKGVFLWNDEGELAWVRLPSFIAKFGKVLQPIEHCVQSNLPRNDKARMILWAQWKGYGDMRTNWFYKALDHEIRRITGMPDVEPIELQEWQVKQSTCWIEDSMWNAFMHLRYNWTEQEMWGVITTLQMIEGWMLPCVYHNEDIQTLIDRDY